MQAPFIFSSLFPEENCSTGHEHTGMHWQQGTSTGWECSEELVTHLWDFGFTSLPCSSAQQLGSAPALYSSALSHWKCSSLTQATMQNVCEEQGFICSVTAGIEKVWHECRLCAWSHWSQLHTRQDISVQYKRQTRSQSVSGPVFPPTQSW